MIYILLWIRLIFFWGGSLFLSRCWVYVRSKFFSKFISKGASVTNDIVSSFLDPMGEDSGIHDVNLWSQFFANPYWKRRLGTGLSNTFHIGYNSIWVTEFISKVYFLLASIAKTFCFDIMNCKCLGSPIFSKHLTKASQESFFFYSSNKHKGK